MTLLPFASCFHIASNWPQTCRPVPWGSLLPPSPDEPSGTKNKLVRHDVSAVYADSKLRSQICDAFRVLADPDKFQRLKGATDTKYGMANLGQWGDLAAIHGGPWQVPYRPTSTQTNP